MTDPETPIAQELLRYWMDRPNAHDTVEGIAEWWLLERFLRRHVAEVRSALAELVRRGWVVERTGEDQRLRYHLDRSRLPDIERHLSEMGPEAGG
jgi:hypothetical protein